MFQTNPKNPASLENADDKNDETEKKKLWNFNYELFELVLTASLTMRFSGELL